MIKLSAKLTTIPVENMLKKRGLEPGGPAEKLMGSETLRLSEPYVPKGGGALERAGTARAGRVAYTAPYARQHYYTPATFQGAPMRGKLWFERMKAGGGKEAILARVKKLAGAK